MKNLLIEKYNVPGPRYTSYPTVPYWKNDLTPNDWESALKNRFESSNQLSLYVHLPFCESMCTYCGCNKVLTKNHDYEEPYIDFVLKEWQLYRDIFGSAPKVSELHLGGGTPTFFSAKNLQKLINGILENTEHSEDKEFAFEAHPEYTTAGQINALAELGFTRISFGIQDFDEVVQKAINRPQSFESVHRSVEQARSGGYESINFDLIYGLPFQTEASIIDAIQKVGELRPDRIAFYGYAHVPWKSRMQRAFSEEDLPSGEEKLKLYELGKSLLANLGYNDIGMDHFALASDSMYKASQDHTLNRNFMGYTTSTNKLLVGLGASSIGDTWDSFAQNEKNVWKYQSLIENGELPIVKGHQLSKEDQAIRKYILDIMCKYETKFGDEDLNQYLQHLDTKLSELIEDKLLLREDNHLFITESGKPFVRNVCMAIDSYLKGDSVSSKFSKTV